MNLSTHRQPAWIDRAIACVVACAMMVQPVILIGDDCGCGGQAESVTAPVAAPSPRGCCQKTRRSCCEVTPEVETRACCCGRADSPEVERGWGSVAASCQCGQQCRCVTPTEPVPPQPAAPDQAPRTDRQTIGFAPGLPVSWPSRDDGPSKSAETHPGEIFAPSAQAICALLSRFNC